jgi:hypothetical protein
MHCQTGGSTYDPAFFIVNGKKFGKGRPSRLIGGGTSLFSDLVPEIQPNDLGSNVRTAAAKFI